MSIEQAITEHARKRKGPMGMHPVDFHTFARSTGARIDTWTHTGSVMESMTVFTGSGPVVVVSDPDAPRRMP